MNVRSIIPLVQGLGMQALCYFGIFLSLSIGARALGGADFGVYASAVAIASFAGAVLTAGLDRILLRVLLQEERTTAWGRVRLPVLLPAVMLNVLALIVVAILIVTRVAAPTLMFIIALAVLIAARLTLGGFFKFAMRNQANVVATFSLQPLVVGGFFGVMLLAAPDAAALADLRCWMMVTIAVESVQLAALVWRARSGGFAIDRARGAAIVGETIEHAAAGAWISLLVLLSQTGLLGLSLGTLLLPPTEMGVYAVALRVSQLILFPVIGITQLVVPISSRSYRDSELPAARREARNLNRLALASLLAAILGFAVTGPWLLPIVLNMADPRAYYCTLILSIGNLGMGLFGVGDQIMIAIGQHRRAFWVSLWCGGVLFLLLASLGFILGFGLIGLACATAIAIGVRGAIGYRVARRLVAMPIAAFDR